MSVILTCTIAYGSYGATNGAKIATAMPTSSITPPSMPIGERERRRHVLRAGPSGRLGADVASTSAVMPRTTRGSSQP